MATRSESRNYVANPADLPRGTLVQLFFDAVDRFRDAEALRYKAGGTWHPITYGEVEERVRRLALALEALGCRRGDRLALLSENRPEWALADYATLCAGGLDVPVYPNLPADQVGYVVKDSGARLAFVSTAEQLEKMQEVRNELPAVEKVIVFDDVQVDDPAVLTFEEALELGRQEEEAGKAEGFRERALSAEPDDVATILYTSGTTGQPKGVMLTHNNIFSNTRATWDLLPVGPDDVALSLLPLSHIFERMVDYKLFAQGCTIAYAESIDKVKENLPEVRPTIVASVPRLYEKTEAAVKSATGIKGKLVAWATRVGKRWAEARLAGRRAGPWTEFQHALADRLVFKKVRAATGGRLRFFVSGGAPLNAELAKFFYSAGILILEGYGLTETSPVTNVNTPDEFRFGTVGKPVPGTEQMIADDGELLVRGPQVMKGYYNMPEATREAIDEDGWFHTGDIGSIDEDGFVRITDRKKEIIVTAGGKNIAPQPIENRIKNSRYVSEAVMVGDRRPFPAVLVVPDFDALRGWASRRTIPVEDQEALVKDPRVQEKLEQEVLGRVSDFARFERPKKVVLLPRELTIEAGEMTPTLKVRRRVVEDHYRELIEELYSEASRVPAK